MTSPYDLGREYEEPFLDPDIHTRLADVDPKPWPGQLHLAPQPHTLHLAAADGELVDSEPISFRLGEPHLPIARYRQHFVDGVRNNPAVVVEAKTGQGKSSQLGLYLLEEGFRRVYVTQPRILAARELLQRGRINLGEHHDHLAGYLTGTQADSDCPPEARLVYITDHLLLKKLNRGAIGPNDAIIFDEMHEESPPSVVALALAREEQQIHPSMRIIVCSATIDADRFARKLKDPASSEPAPVMKFPGRSFPIERLTSEKGVGQEMRWHIRDGKNVIGFEPGLAAMKRTAGIAASRLRRDKVHLLYADQSPAEQRDALNPEDGNHVVTNKTGETSITAPNKQVVVDSGLSNLGSFAEGKKILSTVFASKAAIEQRAGRVGRLEPGLAVLATPDNAPAPPPYEERPDRDPSPIQNTDVTSFMAELLAQGRKLEDLDLLDMPTHENIQYGYTTLRRIGAIALEGEEVVLNDVGRALIDLPLDVAHARMVVESRQLAHEADAGGDELRLQVAALAAVLSAKSMLNAAQGSHRRYAHPKPHQEKLSDEQLSDALFELDVFTWLYGKQQQIITGDNPALTEKFEKLLDSYDILPNRYYKAVRTYEELCLRENLTALELRKPSLRQREYIIGCQITGIPELFIQRGKRTHYDIRGERRTLGRRSTIDARLGSMVAGTAFDLRMLTVKGRAVKQFITDASVVTMDQLKRYAPDRLKEVDMGYTVSRRGQLVQRTAYYFDNELLIGEFDSAVPPTVETRQALISAMMRGAAPGKNGEVQFVPGTPNASAAIKIWRAAQVLENNSPVQLKTEERHASLVRKVVRESLRPESQTYIPLEVTDVEALDTIIPRVYRRALVKPTRQDYVPRILRESPDGITIHVDENQKRYVEVKYKKVGPDASSVAYVWVPRDLRFAITREDFTDLERYHNVKLRIGSGKFMQLDTAFETLQHELASMEANRQRREERRQKIAAMALDVMSSPAVERQKPPVKDDKTIRLEASRRKNPSKKHSRMPRYYASVPDPIN